MTDTLTDHAPASTSPVLRWLAVLAGATWTVATTVVATQADTDPVGAGYDAANRLLTVPLVLLVAFTWQARGSWGTGRPWPGRLLLGGAGMLLLGNVLEFWGVLLSGRHADKTAARLGEDAVFWGSNVGWALFVPGLLAVLVGTVLLARRLDARRGLPLVLLVLFGLAATGLWAVSPLLTAVTSLGLAGWLLLLAGLEDA